MSFLSLLRINNLNPRRAERVGTAFRPPPGADEGRKVKGQRSAETEEISTKVNAGKCKREVLLPLPDLCDYKVQTPKVLDFPRVFRYFRIKFKRYFYGSELKRMFG